MDKQLTFIDFFAGYGGGRRGLELSGMKCVGFCEYDKYAVASYTSMHLITEDQRLFLSSLTQKQRQKEILKGEYRNGEWYWNDVNTLKGNEVPKADVWLFGAPCQSFSVAGKRQGLKGESGLILEILRVLEETEENRPDWIIYENVKGMFSSNRGFDYLAILLKMESLGYDIQWQLFNSADYVPQNRERVYTIGHLRKAGGYSSKVLSFEGTDREDSVCGINILGHRENYRRNLQIFSPDGITEALDTAGGGGRGHHTIEVIGKAYERDNYGDNRNRILGTGGGISLNDSDSIQRTIQSGSVFVGNTSPSEVGMSGNCHFSGGVNPTLITNKDGRNKIAIPVLTPDRPKRQMGRRFKTDGEPSFTLTGMDRHGVAVDIEPIGVVDDQGRLRGGQKMKVIVPTLRSESHGNHPKVIGVLTRH